MVEPQLRQHLEAQSPETLLLLLLLLLLVFIGIFFGHLRKTKTRRINPKTCIAEDCLCRARETRQTAEHAAARLTAGRTCCENRQQTAAVLRHGRGQVGAWLAGWKRSRQLLSLLRHSSAINGQQKRKMAHTFECTDNTQTTEAESPASLPP